MQHFRQGRPGVPPTQAQVRLASSLSSAGVLPQTLARLVGVRSPNTPPNWSLHNMSEEAIRERQLAKGWNRLLAVEEEETAAGWLLCHNMLHLLTRTPEYTGWIAFRFSVTTTPSWLTHHCQRQHMSHLVSHAMNPQEWARNTFDLSLEFLKDIRSLQVPTENIVTPDKKKLFDISSHMSDLGPTGWYISFSLSFFLFSITFPFLRGKPRKISQKIRRGDPFILYGKPNGNGSLDHCYIQTRRHDFDQSFFYNEDVIVEVIPKHCPTIGGELNYLAFAETQVHVGCFFPGKLGLSTSFPSPADVHSVIQDNEPAMNTPAIRNYYLAEDIILRNFPRNLGHLFNPADTRFFSDFDARLRPLVDHLNATDTNTTQNLLLVTTSAYLGAKGESVHHYFRDTGLVPDAFGVYEPPESVVSRLLGEGLIPSMSNYDLHERQLRRYLTDRLERNVLLPIPRQRDLHYGKLWDIYDEFLEFQHRENAEWPEYVEYIQTMTCERGDYTP